MLKLHFPGFISAHRREADWRDAERRLWRRLSQVAAACRWLLSPGLRSLRADPSAHLPDPSTEDTRCAVRWAACPRGAPGVQLGTKAAIWHLNVFQNHWRL